MAKKHPFSKAIEELSDLISNIDSKRDELKTGELPEGLKDQMKDLRKIVQTFKETTQEAIKEAGVDPGTLLKPSHWRDNLSPRDRRMMESLEGLKRELVQRKYDLEKRIVETERGASPETHLSLKSSDKESEEEEKEGEKKKGVRKRKLKRKAKKKFRGLGGDEWLKM